MIEIDKETLNSLLSEHNHFRSLYDKHCDINQYVDAVNAGQDHMDDLDLVELKRQKLVLKDKLTAIIDEYKQAHA